MSHAILFNNNELGTLFLNINIINFTIFQNNLKRLIDL